MKSSGENFDAYVELCSGAGASGFIGRWLLASFVKRGRTFIGSARREEQSKDFAAYEIYGEVLEMDLQNTAPPGLFGKVRLQLHSTRGLRVDHRSVMRR